MFKINISSKDGKTYKIEAEAPNLIEKKLGDTIPGEDISPDLKAYELEITGTSDFAGFTSLKGVEGFSLKKVLLSYGKAMHKKPKGDKKINRKPKGLRLRKKVRGEIISKAITQVNTKVVKEGSKPLKEIFSKEKPAEAPKPEPEKQAEEKKEEKTEAPEVNEAPKLEEKE